jgi:hypothetical protein
VLVGLGADASARHIEVRWPSGAVQKFDDVKSRQILAVTEPPASNDRAIVR